MSSIFQSGKAVFSNGRDPFEPGDHFSSSIPGYIDDRQHDGMADIGKEPVSETISRLLIEKHEESVLNDL